MGEEEATALSVRGCAARVASQATPQAARNPVRWADREGQELFREAGCVGPGTRPGRRSTRRWLLNRCAGFLVPACPLAATWRKIWGSDSREDRRVSQGVRPFRTHRRRRTHDSQPAKALSGLLTDALAQEHPLELSLLKGPSCRTWRLCSAQHVVGRCVNRMSRFLVSVVLGALALGLATCGSDDHVRRSEPIEGLSEGQRACAESLGTPGSFENVLGMCFVLMPPGDFLMGAPDGEGLSRDERPHRVTLGSAFYMQRTETTNGQYRRFRRGHHSGGGGLHPRDDDNQPVVYVTWEDARAFARWISSKDADYDYDLPTEAQWEYSCRAGTTSAFWSGSHKEKLTGVAWVECSYSRAVATTAASPWGLYDMHGNVSEWCLDWYGPYPTGTVRDPQGPEVGVYRIVRGGSYAADYGLARSASRYAHSPDEGAGQRGFRLVAVPSGW